MPYCPNCGTEITGGPRFCPQCGTPITAPPTDIPMKPVTTVAKVSEHRTSGPTVAGVLTIIAGVTMIIIDLIVLSQLLATTGGIFGIILNWVGLGGLITNVRIAIAVAIVLAIVAITGGICALKRRAWGLALAGSICTLLSAVFILGIVAIIFVVTGKSEFRHRSAS